MCLGGLFFRIMFITLLERKILRERQVRLGPNKIGIGGSLQAGLDGLKLFVKDFYYFNYTKKFLFFMMRVLLLLIRAEFGGFFVLKYRGELISLFFLLFFCYFGVLVYRGLFLGWGGTRKFRVLGRIRSVIQSLRFEVAIIFLGFRFILFIDSLSIIFVGIFRVSRVVLNIFSFILILLIFIVERGRPPFDFIEGESELVSGFNVEFFGGRFAFIFIGEYLFILILRLFLVILINFLVVIIFLLLLILGFRCFFPRFRYDKIIKFF